MIQDTIINLIDLALGFEEKGGKGSGHHGHKGIKGRRGGSIPSRGGGVSPTHLASTLKQAGITNLESGNCWVFASAMHEQLKQSGDNPVILDWSGHVDAAVRKGRSWDVYTTKGIVKFEDHWMTKTKRVDKPWRVYKDTDALLKFLDVEYPGISPYRRGELWSNFKKASNIVGGDWSIPNG